MEHRARRQLGWRWLAVAVLAWVAGGVLAETVYGPRAEESSAFVGGLVSGVLLGVLQWLILRLHVRVGLWWTIVTTAVLGLLSYGAALVWSGGLVITSITLWGPYMGPPAAGIYLYYGLASAIVGCLFGGVTGALLGAGQWVVFRRARVASGRWITANVLGLGLGFAAGAVVLVSLMLSFGPSRTVTMLAILLSGGLRGVVSGAITTRTLLRLLQA